MIGIIYKFTSKLSNKFYIGQHLCLSKEDFVKSKKTAYWGSGVIWFNVVNDLKTRFPNVWHKLIKREILCVIKNGDAVLMNKTEKYFIEKFKAEYKYKNGGCNVLPGAPYGEDWVNVMRSSEIRKKVSDKNRVSMKGVLAGEKHWNYGKHRSEETKKKISQAHIGKSVSDKVKEILKFYRCLPKSEEHRKKIGDSQRGEKSVHFGIKLSEEHKNKVGASLIEYYKNNKSKNIGTKWITDGVKCKKIKEGEKLPNGWKFGRIISQR